MLFLSQRNLPQSLFEALDRSLGYDPASDRFGRGDRGGLRVTSAEPKERLSARVTLWAAGWRNLAGLTDEVRHNRDLEDSFLEMAARLPLDFLRWRTGCDIVYDTDSFRHGEQGDYFWDYVVRCEPGRLVEAYQTLKATARLRWMKAHRTLGYDPQTGRFSEDRVREAVDQGHGAGSWERWKTEVAAHDAEVSRFFREVKPPDWGAPPRGVPPGLQ